MNEELLPKIFDKQMSGRYFTPQELMYSSEAGTYVSPYDFQRYLDYLDEKAGNDATDGPCVIPLKTFNSRHIYYLKGKELSALLDNYLNVVAESVQKRKPVIDPKFDEDIIESRIYSEIEGTLNVENVPTTRKRLTDLIKNNADPKDLNDAIIKNMAEGIRFVYTLPPFNRENLLKLYKILSRNCLKDEDDIKENAYYRDDEVEVDNYSGCPSNMIGDCMDSLFAFVNREIANGHSLERFLLPLICHYYIVYIHPYFDYNGRTARMVSLWVNLLLDQTILPPLISEAINQTKNDYYKALRDSREARNDLSYFFFYIFRTTIRYILCYKDLDSIDQHIKNRGVVLTKTELNYVKRVLVTYKGKFAYKDFVANCQIDITKQGALKILNKFVDLGVLNVVDTPSKIKLFDINHEIIHYTKARD